MTETKRPKAVSKEGKIGKVSCYVLDDGRCVLSKTTASVELSSAAAGSKDWDRQIERLAGKVSSLSLPPVFEFVLPGGGVAEAITDEGFMAVVEAYVGGMIHGKLHPQQIPIAQHVYDLQQSWAKIGLRAHILAATGYQPVKIADRISAYAERILRRDPRDWDRKFSTEFVEAVCDVYGWQIHGRRVPHQMAAVFDKLYRMLLGKANKAALKAINPRPHQGSNHHQFIADEFARELPTMTAAIVYIAHRSGRNIDYFWQQVGELIGVTPTQVELPLLDVEARP